MAYKYIDPAMLEKRKRRSTKASGIVSVMIAALCLAVGIFFLAALKSVGGLIAMLVFTLLFAGAAVYFFNQIRIEENRTRALDDPGSKAYRKRQQINAKKRAEYLRKAEHHGSLKSILCRRAALIWGGATVLVWLLSAVFLLAGLFFIIFLVFDIAFPLAFAASLFGKHYRSVLSEYAEYGLDKREAEANFAESRAYLISTDLIAVSRRFLTVSAIPVVLPVDEIVWAYSAYDSIHKYSSGMYSHTERSYCVIAALSDGRQFKIQCPEALCEAILADLADAGTMVTLGYSDELNALYDASPEAFRAAVKDQLHAVHDPVGPEVFNRGGGWNPEP